MKHEKSKNAFEKGLLLCATAEAKATRGQRAPKATLRRRFATAEAKATRGQRAPKATSSAEGGGAWFVPMAIEMNK